MLKQLFCWLNIKVWIFSQSFTSKEGTFDTHSRATHFGPVVPWIVTDVELPGDVELLGEIELPDEVVLPRVFR